MPSPGGATHLAALGNEHWRGQETLLSSRVIRLSVEDMWLLHFGRVATRFCAVPERYYRVYGIATGYSPVSALVQELALADICMSCGLLFLCSYVDIITHEQRNSKSINSLSHPLG